MAVIFAFTHKGNIMNNRRMIKSEDIELGGIELDPDYYEICKARIIK